MNIIIPKHAGFCYGVKKSINMAFALARKGHAYMLGEIVHNPLFVQRLQARGLTLIHDLSEIPADAPAGTKILLRAHGVPLSIIEEITARGFTAIDMTCPDVKKIHAIVKYAAARGMDTIVCGKPGHPEVAGIVSRAATQAVVIRDEAEARQIIPTMQFSPQGVCLVAQTTHNRQAYEAVHAYLANECGNMPFLEPHDTICDATTLRQNELRKLAETADACIIVGGNNSSNVTKLYEIARVLCPYTYHIESAVELETNEAVINEIKKAQTIIIAGGASTPNECVREVETTVRKIESGM